MMGRFECLKLMQIVLAGEFAIPNDSALV